MHWTERDPDFPSTPLERWLERHAGRVLLGSIILFLVMLALMPGGW